VLLGAAIALAEVVIEAGGVTVIAEVAILIVAAEIDAGTRPDCKEVKNDCIRACERTLPTPDHGFKFWNCVKRCMASSGC
jgi:hypothetical protein